MSRARWRGEEACNNCDKIRRVNAFGFCKACWPDIRPRQEHVNLCLGRMRSAANEAVAKREAILQDTELSPEENNLDNDHYSLD